MSSVMPARAAAFESPVTRGAGLCPLCGQGNGCAMEAARVSGEPQPDCWCMTAKIDRQVLARVPAPARGRACICQACASAPVAGR